MCEKVSACNKDIQTIYAFYDISASYNYIFQININSMKRFFILACLSICTQTMSSQSNALCSHHLDIDFPLQTTTKFDSTLQAYAYIDSLMRIVKLPMNFQVRECSEINCNSTNNAYASMNNDGTRFITYDNNWFSRIDTTENKIVALTILSHEIGHHLAAHTLFLNERNYEESRKVCDSSKSTFDPKICREKHLENYKNYLWKRRQNELQADRFAGFIMTKYGLPLSEIHSSYKAFLKPHVDSLSTHPSIDKRVVALTEGFEVANEMNNDNAPYDLNKIKRSKLNIQLSETTRYDRNKLISKLIKSITNIPYEYIKKNSKIEINSHSSGGPPRGLIKPRVEDYLGKSYSGSFLEVEEPEFEYFKYRNYGLVVSHNNRIYYRPHPAIHIKNGVLRILLFEDDESFTVYKSNFNESEISFEEIKTIFIEIYGAGLKNKIEQFEAK